VTARTLLAVHAHPDDETLTMGGTLARYSAAGVRTVVVTCTTGDLGEVALDTPPGPPDVGDLRGRELAAAAATLGVSRVVQLGYGDSGMAGWPENHRPGAFWAADLPRAVEALAAVVRAEQPQVMVVYDATGGYGHPDHVRAHEVGVGAWQACGPERPARLYYVRFPRGWAHTFAARLRAAGIAAPASAATGADAGPAITEIGVPEELVTTAIDVRAYVDTKLAALACHASQMPPTHFLRQMPLSLARELWATEWYSLESGPPRTLPEIDLFDGIP
jgi:LmbE family N-acetylglucosaminyl deacetylase